MKNTLTTLLAVLAVASCCFAHVSLAGLGGISIITGVFTNKLLWVTSGLGILIISALYLAVKNRKSANKQ